MNSSSSAGITPPIPPSAALTYEVLKSNFPFKDIRPKQEQVLKDVAAAFNSGIKYVILEAAPGFGKSPVAITLALSLGSCYICTSTKNLQKQYLRDFRFLRE